MDEYIEPLNSSRILDGAWTLLGQEADKEGLALPPKPAFNDDRTADFALFQTAYVQLAAGAADAKKLRYAAISGMTTTLQDCHTYFLNPVASDTLVDTRAGKGAVGIGIELAGIPPLVTEVYGNGPAAAAGIEVGDRIVSVGGADTSALGPAGAFDLINGGEGTPVTLRLRRPGQDALVDAAATRQRVTPQNVESRLIGTTNVGYVRIRNFVDGGVAAALKAGLDALDAQGATRWIIDLRGNPGGRLDSDAISLFVKDGVIVRDKGRDGAVEEEKASGAVLSAVKPLVLLTNNRTGSVSEVFAAALQEYGVAYVIGANTNGCVGYTDIQPLGDGSSLAVTTNTHLGPVSGRQLNGAGVAPDEAVARTQDDIANARDPQLDAAVAHLGALP
jgi:carboxyl-terminal processing protease